MFLNIFYFFFFQAEDGIRDVAVTGVQTCALPIWFTTKTVGMAKLRNSWHLNVQALRFAWNEQKQVFRQRNRDLADPEWRYNAGIRGFDAPRRSLCGCTPRACSSVG